MELVSIKRLLSIIILIIVFVLIIIGYSRLTQDPIVGTYEGHLQTTTGGYWDIVMIFHPDGKVTITRTPGNSIGETETQIATWQHIGMHYDFNLTSSKIYLQYDPKGDCISFPNSKQAGYIYYYSGTLFRKK